MLDLAIATMLEKPLCSNVYRIVEICFELFPGVQLRFTPGHK